MRSSLFWAKAAKALPTHLAYDPERRARFDREARGHEFFGIELTEAGRVEQGRVEMQRALDLAPDTR